MKNPGPFGFLRGLVRILSGRPQIPPSLADNQLLQIILKRRSVRRFSDRDIPDDVFNAILEAARVAPSTVNLQTWSFAVFNADQWQQTFGRPIPFRANRAVIVMGDTYRVKKVMDVFPYSPLMEYSLGVMNASLAAMNMNIAAEALGISSVMLSETGRSGLLDAGYLKEKLGLPKEVVPIMTIVFGYASEGYPPMPPKLPARQIFFQGQYPLIDEKVSQDWIEQMIAGYKASNLRSSFDAQLQVYRSKIAQAEVDLQDAVFYHGGVPGPDQEK